MLSAENDRQRTAWLSAGVSWVLLGGSVVAQPGNAYGNGTLQGVKQGWEYPHQAVVGVQYQPAGVAPPA